MASKADTKHIWYMINKIAKARNVEPNEIYLWAVQQIVPLKNFSVPNKIADDFIEFWTSKGTGFVAEKKEVVGNETHMIIGAGMTSFYDEQIEELKQLLINTAWENQIPLD